MRSMAISGLTKTQFQLGSVSSCGCGGGQQLKRVVVVVSSKKRLCNSFISTS